MTRLARPGREAEASPAPAPRVTIVGDALLDVDWTGSVERVCPDAPAPVLDAEGEAVRAGGAGLAARLAAEAGADVTLVTALASDAEAERLRVDLDAAGVTVVDVGLQGPTPVKLRVRAGGQSLVRVDRNCSPVASVGPWPDEATEAVQAADAVLVSDYGRGMAGVPAFLALLHGVRGDVPVVWDPHVRGPRPLPGLDLLTPNLKEAAHLAGGSSGDGGSAVARAAQAAQALSRRFDSAVTVTAGEAGAALVELGAEPLVVPIESAFGDPCGAGDCFAAAVVVARALGQGRPAAVSGAVEAARRHVAGVSEASASAGASATVSPDAPWGLTSEAVRLAETTRAAGGTVVVAGGCFDVLHAGHVRLLEAARRMGDCLIVCLNGDLSVRRLKGPRRPVNRVTDRTLVLQSLGCVDAVEVFEDDTPCQALRRLRPHLFVKGADYAGGSLPEQDVMAEWGGQVVFVPLVEGRSTTRILHHVTAAAG